MDVFVVYIISSLFLISLVVFLLIVRAYFKKEISFFRFELAKNNKRDMLPLKLKAVERLTLFLERISPESMILREQSGALLNMHLQGALLLTIRKEFEHNLAMQVYVSSETWERVKLAKEEVVRVVNICASEVNPSNPSIELAKNILERFPFLGASYTGRALESLRIEVNQMSQI